MKKLLLLLTITLTLSCCNNDDDTNTPTNPIDQLPPITQTGANTFGFLVNGEPINVTNTSQQTAIYQGGLLQFGAGGIFMLVQEPFTINTQNDLTGKARYLIDPNPQLGCHYELEDSYEGSVVFSKIDTDNFIISGTFQFSSVNNDCENVDITSGRFDMQYIP
ncbi:hypothetical protein NBRC110019_22240 [Neptunitalea chrysea]|uniref:Lipoprotein n=1 Tax=Neptunitalea chrysea TaxID=1647581 RepID=A0A9W6B5U5_9FLAO|nr:hypothetical protein [Neptunitalea chrysea]GLB53184.1 hypothetical protein NBRC110019_22240 [Neptunitalea chrysea]